MNHLFSKSMNILQLVVRKFSFDTQEVILREINKCGIITLNRPNVLNALNKNVVKLIHPTLLRWKNDTNINHVIIEGAGGKAFCAGGDIRKINEITKVNFIDVCDFFRREYTLNYLVGTFGKPYIALIDGITMGGGFGVSSHGKYRVATDKTLFAMPETAIGTFPGIGGSYFLPRMANNMGMYISLPSHRLKGRDVLFCGMATHYVNSNQIKPLRNELIEATDNEQIDRVLNKYNESNEGHKFSLLPVLDWINEHFSKNSVEDIMSSLSRRVKSSNLEDEKSWCQHQINVIRKMSPTSVKVTFRQLREGQKLSFADCFTMEFRLTTRFLENKDFHEGVRALIIDKDNKPIWSPPTLEEVTDEMVDKYFQPLPEDLILK